MHTPLDAYHLPNHSMGQVGFRLFNPKTGATRKMIQRRNSVLYSGADLLARLLATGAPKLNAMYIEFKNLAAPVDPIVPPAYDRSGGLAYYNGLDSSPDTDFIRVPLLAEPARTSSDAELYDANQLTIFAQTEGLVGFHGKPFSPSANSAVFGAALIGSPDLGDQTQDLVFARVYTGIDKLLKEEGHEIGVTWVVRLT